MNRRKKLVNSVQYIHYEMISKTNSKDSGELYPQHSVPAWIVDGVDGAP